MDTTVRASTIIWNNKHILTDGKSVFLQLIKKRDCHAWRSCKWQEWSNFQTEPKWIKFHTYGSVSFDANLWCPTDALAKFIDILCCLSFNTCWSFQVILYISFQFWSAVCLLYRATRVFGKRGIHFSSLSATETWGYRMVIMDIFAE